MPPLTASELAHIRILLTPRFSSSFTDEVLQEFAESAYTLKPDTYVYGTVAIAFYSLMTGAINFTTFTQGETREEQGKIYDRIEKLYLRWSKAAGILGGGKARVKPVRQGYVVLPDDDDDYVNEWGTRY
jgi:hypothetical protein